MNMSTSKRSGILGRILLGILGAVCLFGPQAEATFIATIDEVGPNVVVAGSGTIDLTALSFFNSGGTGALMNPSMAVLSLSSGTIGTYSGFSGPASFGSGGPIVANSFSGAPVGINATAGLLLVPQGYGSGNPLFATSTYNNATFASLGVTPGIYTWTWGSGMNADSFTINARVSGAVPETGSTLMLLLIPAGLMFLATCRSRRLISVQ